MGDACSCCRLFAAAVIKAILCALTFGRVNSLRSRSRHECERTHLRWEREASRACGACLRRTITSRAHPTSARVPAWENSERVRDDAQAAGDVRRRGPRRGVPPDGLAGAELPVARAARDPRRSEERRVGKAGGVTRAAA